ncbi:MAG: UDP-glucose 4-epimerase [Bacteroidetes bacterium]|nr:MAG: UDP-glucose 4-epimerase [Bacteroidota bacterium]
MDKISLVTGGAGFIGSHVVGYLLSNGHKVVVLDDLSCGLKENVHPEAILRIGTITDKGFVNQLFEEFNFDYVYHLAAYAAEGLSHFIRKFNYENNLIGSVNLINAAVNYKVKCFVFTSSIAVYGTNDLPLIETQKPQPEDPYGIAKYAVEMDLKAAHEMFALDFIIFRPHNVYGPKQNIGDKYRNVVGIFMNRILQQQPLSIFGDGEQTRAFSYIDDVAPYIAESVNNADALNHVFNVGSNDFYTVNELAEAVSLSMGVEPNILKLPKREEVVHAYADHNKFEEVFNPRKAISLQNGLAKMVAWVKDDGAQQGTTFNNIEINKNLPKFWRQ